VDNAPAPHELLRNGEWAKFHKKRKVREVVLALGAKRRVVGYHQELLDLFEAHLATINALQPISLSRFNCDNHRADVSQAATQAIAELRAWQPPVAVAVQGPPPGPPGPPPGPPGPPPGPPGPAEPRRGPGKRSGAPDRDAGPTAPKRALVSAS
jgi:hypothetical protein